MGQIIIMISDQKGFTKYYFSFFLIFKSLMVLCTTLYHVNLRESKINSKNIKYKKLKNEKKKKKIKPKQASIYYIWIILTFKHKLEVPH